MDPLPLPADPGPPPRLSGGVLVLYMCKRMDDLETRMEEAIKDAAKWRYRADRAARRSDYINIFVVSAHGLWLSLGAIGGMLAGSYMLVFHNWYVERLVNTVQGWLHGLL